MGLDRTDREREMTEIDSKPGLDRLEQLEEVARLAEEFKVTDRKDYGVKKQAFLDATTDFIHVSSSDRIAAFEAVSPKAS